MFPLHLEKLSEWIPKLKKNDILIHSLRLHQRLQKHIFEQEESNGKVPWSMTVIVTHHKLLSRVDSVYWYLDLVPSKRGRINPVGTSTPVTSEIFYMILLKVK